MEPVLRYIQRLALAFWLGEMLFFVTVFAPKVFRVLPREMAGKLQSNIFPGYFTVGILCAVVLLVTELLRQKVRGTGFFARSEQIFAGRRQGLQFFPLALVLISGGIFAYCLLYLTPAIDELRLALYATAEQNPDQLASFDFLHQQSVVLNAVVLLILLIILALI